LILYRRSCLKTTYLVAKGAFRSLQAAIFEQLRKIIFLEILFEILIVEIH